MSQGNVSDKAMVILMGGGAGLIGFAPEDFDPPKREVAPARPLPKRRVIGRCFGCDTKISNNKDYCLACKPGLENKCE